MKYDIQFTSQFKKDLRLAKKQNKNKIYYQTEDVDKEIVHTQLYQEHQALFRGESQRRNRQ